MEEGNRDQIPIEDLERQYRDIRQLSLNLTVQIPDILNTLPLIVLLFVDAASLTVVNLFVLYILLSNLLVLIKIQKNG